MEFIFIFMWFLVIKINSYVQTFAWQCTLMLLLTDLYVFYHHQFINTKKSGIFYLVKDKQLTFL